MLAPACLRHAGHGVYILASPAMAGRWVARAGRWVARAGRSPGIVCIRPPSSRGNGGQGSLSVKTKHFLNLCSLCVLCVLCVLCGNVLYRKDDHGLIYLVHISDDSFITTFYCYVLPFAKSFQVYV